MQSAAGDRMPACLIPQESPTPTALIQLFGLLAKAFSHFSKLSNSFTSRGQEAASNGRKLKESGEGTLQHFRQWQSTLCRLCAPLRRTDDDEQRATTRAQELPLLQHICNMTCSVPTAVWDKQGRSLYAACAGFGNPRNVTAFKKTGAPEKAPPPAASQTDSAVTVGIIERWAQLSKSQPFLKLPETMRTWGKELAPLWGSSHNGGFVQS